MSHGRGPRDRRTRTGSTCGGKSTTNDEVAGDGGAKDGKAEGGNEDAADQQVYDIVPQNDVALDHAPAE